MEQTIKLKIQELLRLICPSQLDICFVGNIYPTHWAGGLDVKSTPYTEEDYEYLSEINSLMKLWQQKDYQKGIYWTHFKISWTQTQGVGFEFANIAETDNWPNLYMKGISELTWAEADAHHIPYDIWKKKSKRYISEHDRFYQELLSIFERNMERVGWTILFRGCIYQGQPQYEAFAIEADGTFHPQALELKKSQHLRLPKLLRQMQKSKLYPQPWTHFECRLGFMIPFEFQVSRHPETEPSANHHV